MARTTIDLDDGVLEELRKRREREHRSIGVIASELLARALAEDPADSSAPPTWVSRSMGAKIDIDDREELWAALDRRR